MIAKATNIGELSYNVLDVFGLANNLSKKEDLLLDLAKEVAAATAKLAKSSKQVANSLSPDVDPKGLIDDVTRCILSTSDMIAVAKLVAPNIEDKKSKKLMMEAVQTFDKKLVTCVENALQVANDREAMQKMEAAAKNVKRTLNALKSVLREEQPENINEVMHDIVKTFNALTTSQNYGDTIQKVKDLTRNCSKLVKALEKEMVLQDDLHYKEVLQGLIDEISLSTSTVLEAAKVCASNPHGRAASQERLLAAVRDLTDVAQHATNIVNRRKLFHQLETVARNAASDANACMEACDASQEHRLVTPASSELAKVRSRLTEPTVSLQRAVQVSQDNPVSARAQTNLMEQAEEFSVSALEMIAKSKSSMNQIGDKEAKSKFQSAASNFERSLNELINQMKRAEKAAESVRYEATKELLESLDPQLSEIGTILNSLNHRPTRGEYLNDYVSDLISASSAVQNDIFKISKALDSGDLNQIQSLVGSLGQNINSLVLAVKDVAGTSGEVEESKQLVTTAQSLLATATSFVQTLNRANSSGTIDAKMRSEILNNCDSLSKQTNNISNFGRLLSTLGDNDVDLDDLKLSIEENLQNMNNQNLQSTLENLLKYEETVQEELKKIKVTSPSDEVKAVVSEYSENLSQKKSDLLQMRESGRGPRDDIVAAGHDFALSLSQVTEYLARTSAFTKLAGRLEKTIPAAQHFTDQLAGSAEAENAVAGLKQTIGLVCRSLQDYQEKPASHIAKANLLTDASDLLKAGNTAVARGREAEGLSEDARDSIEALAAALASLSKDKKKAEDVGQLLEIDAAEELLESLTAELENFKMTSKALGSEAWDTGKKAESEVFEKTVEMNKDLGMFVNSALENHKKNMSKGAIKIGRNMEQFVRSTTAAAAALDGDESKRKDLIRNTEMAIKDAKHVLLNAKERFND